MAQRSFLLLLLLTLFTTSLTNSTAPDENNNNLPAIPDNPQTEISRIESRVRSEIIGWEAELMDEFLELVLITKQESSREWERVESETEATNTKRQEEFQRVQETITKEKKDEIHKVEEVAKQKFQESIHNPEPAPSVGLQTPSFTDNIVEQIMQKGNKVALWWQGLDIPKQLEELEEWRRARTQDLGAHAEDALVRVAAWWNGLGWTRKLGTSSVLAGWEQRRDWSILTDPSRWRMPSWDEIKATPVEPVLFWVLIASALLPLLFVTYYRRTRSASKVLPRHEPSIADGILRIWTPFLESATRELDSFCSSSSSSSFPATPFVHAPLHPLQLNPSDIPPMPSFSSDPSVPGFDAPQPRAQDQENSGAINDAEILDGAEPYDIKEDGGDQSDDVDEEVLDEDEDSGELERVPSAHNPDSHPPRIYFEHQEDERANNYVHEIELDAPANRGAAHSASPRSDLNTRNSPIKSFQVITKPGTPVPTEPAHEDPIVATTSADSQSDPTPLSPLVATHSQPVSPRKEDEHASVALETPQTPDSPQVSSQSTSAHESFESQHESQHNDAHHDSTEAQPESQPDSRPGSRQESHPESRSSSRQESRPESQSSSRQESRPDSRSDSRAGSRAESRSEVRLGANENLVRVSRESSQIRVSHESRTDSRPESRSEMQLGMSHDSMQSEPESQAESYYNAHHDSSHDSHPESQPASRPESRTSSRPDSRSGSRPTSRSDSRATSAIELSPEIRPESRSITPDTPESYNESRPASRFDWRPESRLDRHPESQPDSPAVPRSEPRSAEQAESQPDFIESPPDSPYKPLNPNQNPPVTPNSTSRSQNGSPKSTEQSFDHRPDSPSDNFNDLDSTFHEDLKLNLSKHINKDLKGSFSNMEPEQHTTRRITPRANNNSPLHAKFSTMFDISMTSEEPEGEEQEEIEPEPQPSDTEPESENDLEPELESESLQKARQRSDPRRATTPKRSPLLPRATTPKRAARTPTPKQPKPEPEPEPDPFSDPEAESAPQRELEHSAEFGSEFDPESQPESESELDGDASPLPRSAITSPMEFQGRPSPLPPTLSLSPAIPLLPQSPALPHQPSQSPDSPSPDALESPLRQGLAQLEGNAPKGV